MPPKIKPYYLAYHAFFLEIIRSRFVSKEQSVCGTRLTFWEESLHEAIQKVNYYI